MTEPAKRPRAAATFYLALIAASACGGDDADEVAGPELLDLGAQQVAIGVRHILTADGVRRAQLIADTALFLEGDAFVRFRGVRVYFYGDLGEEVSILRADEGLVNLQTEDMEATGSVVVVDQDQSERLETQTLSYDAAADQLRSDVDFVFYRGSNTIRGRGFVSDPGLDTVYVTRPSAVTPRPSGP